MDIRLQKSQFVDGRFSQSFSTNKVATFIVVKESFHGNNTLGVVDRINIFIESFDVTGAKIGGSFSSSVIGIGDALAGVLTTDTTLLGKLFSWDNLEQCTVRLYEQ
jgi:hypothetical protein